MTGTNLYKGMRYEFRLFIHKFNKDSVLKSDIEVYEEIEIRKLLSRSKFKKWNCWQWTDDQVHGAWTHFTPDTDYWLRVHCSDIQIINPWGPVTCFSIISWFQNWKEMELKPYSLAHHHVSNSHISVVYLLSSMSGLDHVSISELHSLCTLSTTKLFGNNNLTSLIIRLHEDKTSEQLRNMQYSKSSKKLVLKRLSLSLTLTVHSCKAFASRYRTLYFLVDIDTEIIDSI